MHRVAKLVKQDVVNQMGRQEEQFVVQANGSPAGTTPPPGLLPAYLGGPEAKSGLEAELLQPGGKMEATLSLQPPAQQGQAAFPVADIPMQLKA